MACSMCGRTGGLLCGVRVQVFVPSNGGEGPIRKPAEQFTITNGAGQSLFKGFEGPVDMPSRAAWQGPITYQVLAAYLYNQSLLPPNAIITNGDTVPGKDDIVYATPGTNTAHLVCNIDPTNSELDKYGVNRKSALNPLPDGGTVFTHRVLEVHSTNPRIRRCRNDVTDALLCVECKQLYEQL